MLKKIGKSIIFILLAIPSLAFAANGVAPTNYTTFNTFVVPTIDTGYRARAFDTTGLAGLLAAFPGDSGNNWKVQSASGDAWFPTGGIGGTITLGQNFHILFFATSNVLANTCWQDDPNTAGGPLGETNDYTYCSSVSSSNITVSYSSPPAAPTGVAGLISAASSTLNNAIGITPHKSVIWVKGIAFTIVGSGLGVFESLAPFIIALVLMSGIIYFAYRGLRFMKR